MKELFKIFITANLLVFSLLVSYKFYGYIHYVAEPLYKIRTNDGIYYSTRFKHFADTVTFLDNRTGETLQKNQDQLSGTIIERIR